MKSSAQPRASRQPPIPQATRAKKARTAQQRVGSARAALLVKGTAQSEGVLYSLHRRCRLHRHKAPHLHMRSEQARSRRKTRRYVRKRDASCQLLHHFVGGPSKQHAGAVALSSSAVVVDPSRVTNPTPPPPRLSCCVQRAGGRPEATCACVSSCWFDARRRQSARRTPRRRPPAAVRVPATRSRTKHVSSVAAAELPEAPPCVVRRELQRQ